MKNTKKVLGIIALIAIIGFAAMWFTGCFIAPEPVPGTEPGTGTEETPITDPILFGTWVGTGKTSYSQQYGTLIIDGDSWTSTDVGEYDINTSSVAGDIAYFVSNYIKAQKDGKATITIGNGEIRVKQGTLDMVSNKYKVEGNTLTIAGSPNFNFDSPRFIGVKATGGGEEPEEPDWKSGDVWLQTKKSNYAIVEDEEEEVLVAGEIKSEMTTEWTIYRYASNRKFEKKYKDTQTTGYMEYYKNRNGLIEESNTKGSITIGENTYTVDSKVKKEYDSTGLMVAKETKINAAGEEEEPTVNSITLLSDSGGIKTYKYDDGYFPREYKIQNGEIIEDKVLSSSSPKGYSYIINYSLPTNEVVRAKLPDFRLETMTGNGSMYLDNYQEVEVVSDSDSELVIRVKTFSKTWGSGSEFELDELSEFTYTKFTYPFNTEE